MRIETTRRRRAGSLVASHLACVFLVAVLVRVAPDEIPRSAVLHRYGMLIVHLAQLVEHYYLEPASCARPRTAHPVPRTRSPELPQ